MSGQLLGPLADVFGEMIRAEAKHGDQYMGNLDDAARPTTGVLLEIIRVGRLAKAELEAGRVSKMSVLMEEVGEIAEALHDGIDCEPEVTQVSAMGLSWMGVDARGALRRMATGNEEAVA